MSLRLSEMFLSSQSDERLVKLVRAGHERAFAAIVERYRPELSALARRLSQDGKGEDVVQQAFLSAFAALRAGCEVEHLRGWLYQILRNASARERSPLFVPLDSTTATAETLEDLVQQRALALSTLAELQRLPQRQREAIVGTALGGLARAEVANSMGVSEGAVRQLVHRARASLRSAVTATTPWPLARWLIATRPAGRGTVDLYAGAGTSGAAGLAASAGAASSGGVAIKLGVVLASGSLATGIAAVGRHGAGSHRSGSRAAISTHARSGGRGNNTATVAGRTSSSPTNVGVSRPALAGIVAPVSLRRTSGVSSADRPGVRAPVGARRPATFSRGRGETASSTKHSGRPGSGGSDSGGENQRASQAAARSGSHGQGGGDRRDGTQTEIALPSRTASRGDRRNVRQTELGLPSRRASSGEGSDHGHGSTPAGPSGD